MAAENLELDFEAVLEFLGEDTHKKSGNMFCPFCSRRTFRVYPDTQRAKCHNDPCGWSGDVLQFYSEKKGITRNEAFKEIAEALHLKTLKLTKKELTSKEARQALAADLEFLAWCRMYFAFYKSDRVNQQTYAAKAGLSQPAFNRILNGDMQNVTTWHKTLNILRTEIPMKQFKDDLKLKAGYFAEGLESFLVEKYRKKK